MKPKITKLVCLLLICVLMAGMLPMTALAAETSSDTSATVYFTVERGIGFVTANGETMGMQKLTVPYFDLALYGREDLYYNPDCYKGNGQQSQAPGNDENQ